MIRGIGHRSSVSRRRSIGRAALFALLGVSGCAGTSPFTNHSRPVSEALVDATTVEGEFSGGVQPLQHADAQEMTARNELPTVKPVVAIELDRRGEALVQAAIPPTLSLTQADPDEIWEPTDNNTLVQGDRDASSRPAANRGTANATSGAVDLNLPSVLAMVGGQHPAVGFARWRVQEAYAELARAEALWLPSIRTGFSFHRHDGNYQASNGDIVDVNRNSFQYGLGVGGTGAGTTPSPGVVAQFHFADAIFLPRVTRKTAWARSHAAGATLNRQMRDAAHAYLDLLDAHQLTRLLMESKTRLADLAKITLDYAEAGEGLQADADRLQTELAMVQNRLIAAHEQVEVASARLAQTISLNGSPRIEPLDVGVFPLQIVSDSDDPPALIGLGLSMRPELKESQALVAAACDAYQREKYAPLVPSVLLGFSTGGFGGGLGNELDDVRGRYDLDAAMSWELRNLGLGERAERRRTSARVQQAKFEKVRVMDRVAREISEAESQVRFRRQQIKLTRQATQAARDSYARNLERIRDGQGLPLEVLQSVQALETTERAYLAAVTGFNRAQFQLQWALGWPVSGPTP